MSRIFGLFVAAMMAVSSIFTAPQHQAQTPTSTPQKSQQSTEAPAQPEQKPQTRFWNWGGQASQNINPYLNVPCDPNAPVAFTHDVTDNSLIQTVEPTIITPGSSRHRAWLDIDTSKASKVPVYAPADGELVEGVYKNARGALDYDLHIQISCKIWYLINHVTDPVDVIKAAYPSTPQSDTRINGPLPHAVPVKAGELLGYTSGTPTAHNFDFGVFDLDHVNPGLPADTGSEYGKEKNFICPFDMLPEPIKKAYYEKMLPSDKPYTNCLAY